MSPSQRTHNGRISRRHEPSTAWAVMAHLPGAGRGQKAQRSTVFWVYRSCPRCYNGRVSLKEGWCSFWGLGLHPVRSGFSLHRGGGGGLRRDATAVVRTGL